MERIPQAIDPVEVVMDRLGDRGWTMAWSVFCLGAVLCLGLSTTLAAGAETGPARQAEPGPAWPHLRGPALDGSVEAPGLAGAPALEMEALWRRPVGSGYASVAVTDGLAITTGVVTAAASGEPRNAVLALDAATGGEVWRFDLGPVFLGRQGSDDGPIATPTLHGERVFVLDPAGRFVALALRDGRLLWERHLVEDFGATMPIYGFSSMPVARGDQVALLAGGGDGRQVVALEAATGELRWHAGDDTVEYHNASLWQGGGEPQLVAPGSRSLAGYRWRDGRPLWHFELAERTSDGDVVPVDGERLLFHSYAPPTYLLAVTPAGDGGAAASPWQVEELWRTEALAYTYAAPVVHAGHVFGYARRFLSALDLETGERLWRSRPPGGQAVLRLGEHLVLLGSRGELVTVAASAEGYRETGRLEVFEGRGSISPVTAAGDRLFLRDLDEVVAVRVRAGRTPVSVAEAAAAVPPAGRLAELVAAVREADDPAAAADAFFERHPPPWIEDGEARFVFHGEVADLAIVGDMTGAIAEQPLERVPGTDVYHLSFPMAADERWEYVFKVFEERRPDPANPRRVASAQGESSVALGPEWRSRVPRCEDCPPGTLETLELSPPEDARGGPEAVYRMHVWTPPAAEPGEGAEGPLPVVIFPEGEGALRFGEVPELLAATVGRRVEPLVAVFLELPGHLWWERARPQLLALLEQQVMPRLEERFPLRQDSAGRALVATGWSVESTFLWALESEASLGRVAVLSPLLGPGVVERNLQPVIAGLGEEDGPPRRFWLDHGTSDAEHEPWGVAAAAHSRQLAAALEATGQEVVLEQSPGGPRWGRWRERIPGILQAWFPLVAEEATESR